ncbi:FAD-binding protein [Streptomyces daliensis]
MLTTGPPTRNWAGNTTFGAARVHRPASLDELRDLVASATRVRALGSGHSFNRIADTSGDLVRVDGLPSKIETDGTCATVTVGAGTRYGELAAVLHSQGRALANMASLPHISVAGSCATGTHGSGSAQRSLASAVAGFNVVGPDGEVRRMSRDADPECFTGTVVSLGALGVVTELTLDTEPAFEVAQWVYDGVPLERLAEHFDEIFGSAYSVSAFADWLDGTAVVWLKRRTDRHGTEHPGPAWQGGRLAEGPRHPIPGMAPDSCTTQGGVPGPWFERLPHFRPDFTPSNGTELQSELYLPRERAPEVLAALRGLAGVIGPVLQTSEVRTVAAEDLWLSPAYGRDSLTVHFTWVQDTAAVLPAIAAMEELLMPLEARPHWGKLTTTSPGEIVALYERAPEFAALLQEHDPEGKFRNPFMAHLFPGLPSAVPAPDPASR